jgi:hypothetical protein
MPSNDMVRSFPPVVADPVQVSTILARISLSAITILIGGVNFRESIPATY